MKKQPQTLVIVHQPPRVLLGLKKRGFGEGRWNGFGGKVNPQETIEQAARRELQEEAGIVAGDLKLLGQLDFEFQAQAEILAVNIFKVREYQGEPQESEEMTPQWFHIDEIPFRQMWPDDVYWMPLFLKNRQFRGRFVFGQGDKILEQEIEMLEALER